MSGAEPEIRLLLEAIYHRYEYDFRDYAVASLERRVRRAVEKLGTRTIAGLQERVLNDPEGFSQLLPYLTVPVSEMFRDPAHFRALRERVVPVLRTYPSLEVWVAGCSTGEEVYSLAILLKEERLLDRTVIHATDINPESLSTAESGVYELSRIRQFIGSHRLAGGTGPLTAHYSVAEGAAVVDRSLREHIVFSDHNLATDGMFAKVQLILCRNVLIYFNRRLQERAVGLFRESLREGGFLGLGSRESLRFTAHADAFEEVARLPRIYRKVAE